MKVPSDMNFFIFDESNITALDINGDRMNNLYINQKEIFDKYSVPNYIFVVDSQDESTEELSVTTHNLAEYLRKKYNINKDNAIILLISISPGKIKVRTGQTIRSKITDNESNKMISNLKSYLKNKKYYDAWNQFIFDINKYYYENAESESNIKSKSDKSNKTVLIIVIICGVAFYSTIITISIYCCRKNCKKKEKMNEINAFLNANGNNYEIFKENCVICLKKLNNTQIQITTQTDFNNTQQQNNTNENNITTLKCGHQYHNICLSKHNIKDCCPICLKQNDPILKYNNEKIIWAIQQNLFPSLWLYPPTEKNVTDDSSDGGNSYSAPSNGSYGGGSVGGGSYGGGSVGGGSVGSGGAQGSF